MKLSVVIPVYNEKTTILELLSRVEKVELYGVEKEIIIVDDCSTDGTRALLKPCETKHRVIYQEKNQGKGAALRTGFALATGDIIIVQDADLELNPTEYPQLLEPILKGEADVVYGSRFLGNYSHLVLNFRSYAANKLVTFISNFFTNLHLTDMETGYKVFKKSILDSITLKENRFGFEPEVTAKISKLKTARIYEVGISYAGRTHAQGKKIGWKDGLRAIWCIIKYNLFS